MSNFFSNHVNNVLFNSIFLENIIPTLSWGVKYASMIIDPAIYGFITNETNHLYICDKSIITFRKPTMLEIFQHIIC